MSKAELRVLIVADDPLARAGLATLLTDRLECVVAGQVSEELDLAVALEAYAPDVLLWDLGWEAELSLERLAELGEDEWPVVALLPDDACAADARAAGVRGLLLRDATAEKLVSTLVSVAQGVLVLDPALADAVLTPAGGRVSEPLVEALTPRELEVLQLLAEGLPNKAIAHRLSISEHTVKFHVNAIMTKLGAQSRTEAAVRATRLGLIWL